METVKYKTSTETNLCFHCGESCKGKPIFFENHPFCCNGCKTVYEILGGCDLDNYYNIEESPGIKPQDIAGDFEFLELPEVQEQLIQYEDDDIYKLTLNIPQIHCSSCIYLLEQLHQINPDVITSRVNFQRKEITLTVRKTETILYDIFHLLNRIGYTPQLPSKEKQLTNSSSKSLLIKIGVAGFCFGNIMLLSFPDYIAGTSVIDEKFRSIFKYLILLFVLPVIFYAAKDYYTAAYKNLKHKYLSVDVPIVFGISALFLRSIYEIFVLDHPGYFDSLAGFIFFLLIGKWFQSRTYDNLSFNKSFSSFFPLAVLRKEGDTFKTANVKALEVGDIIQLRNREILPVNAQLLDEQATFDYSFVTGESKSIQKKQKEHLFAGGQLSGATAQFLVTATVEQEYLKELWSTSEKDNQEGKLTSIIDAVSQKFTLAIIFLAIVGLIFWWSFQNFNKALEVFTSILIVACPCALALAAPFTYGNASRLLSKINVFLKDSSIIEQLSKIGTLVFDKTGTLTQKDETEINYSGQELSQTIEQEIHSIVSSSIHPLSKILTEHFNKTNSTLLSVDAYQETAGKGIKAKIGKQEYVIGSKAWLLENEIAIESTETNQRSLVFIAKDDKFLGYFEISNVYRANLLEEIKALAKSHSTSILSGDGNSEEDFLKTQFNGEVQLVFQQSPEQKEVYIKQLTSTTSKGVMMLGDGINDAMALKASDIGVAITEDTGSFTPNSDIIMQAKSLVKLSSILTFGKDCQKILYTCLIISLLYNVIGFGFAFAGLLSPLVAAILMPLSSISVVFIAVGLTNYYASKRKISL